MRYTIMQKSKSAHCCFAFTVMDTLRPDGYTDEAGIHYATMCECFSEAEANTICDALNAYQGRHYQDMQ